MKWYRRINKTEKKKGKAKNKQNLPSTKTCKSSSRNISEAGSEAISKKKRKLTVKNIWNGWKKEQPIKETNQKTIKTAETYHLQNHNLKCLQEKKEKND